MLPVIRHVYLGLSLSARPRTRKKPGAASAAARARIPSDPKKVRREHGMLPPELEATLYARFLRAHFERLQERLLAELARRTDAADPPTFGAGVADFGVRVATKNAREFRRVFGLKARAVEPGISERIDRFRTESLAKVRSLEAEQLSEFRGILDEGLEQGAHADAIAKRVKDRFGVTQSKAELLARDQVLKLNSALTKDRQTRAGVTKYRWITAHDDRVRGNPSGQYPGARNHWRLHGTVQSWSEPPITDESTGVRAHPGEEPQCRCVAVPEIEELSTEDEALFNEVVGAPEEVVPPAPAALPAPPSPLRGALRAAAQVARGQFKRSLAALTEGALPDSELKYLREGHREASFEHVRSLYRGKVPDEVAVSLDPINIDIYPGERPNLRDGRHRLKVAKEMGATRILAEITQYNSKGDRVKSYRRIIPIPF